MKKIGKDINFGTHIIQLTEHYDRYFLNIRQGRSNGIMYPLLPELDLVADQLTTLGTSLLQLAEDIKTKRIE